MERYDINSMPKANTAEAGALRVANSVDEKNCGCVDAAITPSNLYNLLGCRKANTSYTIGEVVTCPYHPEFLLKCTVAGSTATGSLDTTSATLGKVYTDGGVKWEVINPLNDYLPITGGTLRGTLYANGNAIAGWIAGSYDDDTASAMIAARLDETHYGAYLRLCGTKHSTPARFELGCYLDGVSGNVAKRLIGDYNGNLTWCGQNVLTPVGTIITYSGESVPNGYLDCSGASLNPTTYANLFNVIGTTYGGDGVTTFNLPNLNNGSFLEGSNTVGVVKEAGLPNITGNLTSHASAVPVFGLQDNTLFTAVNTSSQRLPYPSSTGGYEATHKVNFDASKANAIYGNSDTVQPKAVTVKFCIKY